MITIKIFTYFLVGFVEWFLATQRTWDISHDNRNRAATIALIEDWLGTFVFVYILFNPNQWWLLLFGGIGAALGVWLNLKTPWR